MFHPPLPFGADLATRRARYDDVHATLRTLLEDDDDAVSVMATIATELHHAFAWFHWTGFYRTIAPELLAVGPYQGGHGCTRIPYDRGVCGAAARSARVQLVPDVSAFEGHIPCSSSTRSEVVLPIFGPSGEVTGVLDVDSDEPAAFDELDVERLASIVGLLAPFERL